MIPEDPLAEGGIAGFARRFRSGETTSAAVTRGFLNRIAAIDDQINAFWYVDAEGAMAAAEAMDAARAAGFDLGPLMGVPVAIKDLIAVDGMPVTYGTKLDIRQRSDAEGAHVRSLRNCGCVIIGKTATVELAFGTTGINRSMGTPRNPHDPDTFRVCGGSSSGSGAAVAAGLAGFAVGTDTGGSVRIPAALCGVFGHKTTKGLISMEGTFPLSPTFDTIGVLARSAADAALIYTATTGARVPEVALSSIRLRRPLNHFFDDLGSEVAEVINLAIDRLEKAGVAFAGIAIPETTEREWIYSKIVPAELISAIGADRFEAGRSEMDSLTALRAAAGLTTKATDYIDALKRKDELASAIGRRLSPDEALITPSVPIVAPPAAELEVVEVARSIHNLLVRNVQPMGIFGQCAVSLPLNQGREGRMPVGLQLARAGGQDAELLGMACAVERLLGAPELARVRPSSPTVRIGGK